MSTLPTLTDALLTLEERVAVLTLNRHDLRNALTGSALIDDIVATQWEEARVKDREEIKEMTDQGAILHIADDAEITRWQELTQGTSKSFYDSYPNAQAAMQALEATCGSAG